MSKIIYTDINLSNKKNDKSLLDSHPQLVVEEWDFKKNNNMQVYPENTSPNCNKAVYWICKKKGHSWKASPYNRTKKTKPTGCKICNANKSFGEYAILYYVKKAFGECAVENRVLLSEVIKSPKLEKRRLEADIYIKPLNMIIEHNSEHYHNEAETVVYDIEKSELILQESNCRLITFTCYKSVGKRNSTSYAYKESKKAEFQSELKRFFKEQTDFPNLDINLKEDSMKILALYYHSKEQTDLAKDDIRFKLAKEWDIERNEGFKIFDFKKNSQYYAHWRCQECGHKWVALISNRSKNRDCPKCRLKKSINTRLNKIKKEQSFGYKYSDKLKNWDYEKNKSNNIYPDKITAGSNKLVNWKCDICGYNWSAPVSSVIKSTYGGCCKCGIERSRKAKYKALLKIDPSTGLVLQRFESISAAKKEGFKKVERAFEGKIYKGFLWKKE